MWCRFALAALFLAGCGKELGRIPLRGDDSAATSVNVQQGTNLSLWTSLDVDLLEGEELVARYEVELYESGQLTGRTTCDPLDVSVKTGAKEVTVGSRRSLAWSGKMRCELVAKSKGLAHVRAKLVFEKRPSSLSVRDMALVIKR
jgi:hypothetical protein